MPATDWFACVAGLAAIAAAGRCVLAVLPPGELGSHRPRALVATWAASHVLGLAAFAVSAMIAQLVGAPRSLLALCAPWVVLAGLRLATLPGSLRPRHDPPRERPSGPARAAGVLLAVALLAPAFAALLRASDPAVQAALPRATSELARAAILVASLGDDARHVAASIALTGATLCSLFALLAHGLATSRRAPFARRLTLLVFALIPFVLRAAEIGVGEIALGALSGAGLVGMIAWLRRADRRGAALAALCFCACPLAAPGGWPIAIAGTAVLALATRPAGRRTPLSWIAAGAAVNAVPWMLVRGLDGRAPWSGSLSFSGPWSARFETFALALPRESAEFERWSVVWFATALTLVLAAFTVWRQADEARKADAVDPPLAELRALLAFFVLALIGRAVGLALEPGDPIAHAAIAARFALWSLLPCAALIIGLALVRAERPT
jgi:hypothetical protein